MNCDPCSSFTLRRACQGAEGQHNLDRKGKGEGHKEETWTWTGHPSSPSPSSIPHSAPCMHAFRGPDSARTYTMSALDSAGRIWGWGAHTAGTAPAGRGRPSGAPAGGRRLHGGRRREVLTAYMGGGSKGPHGWGRTCRGGTCMGGSWEAHHACMESWYPSGSAGRGTQERGR